ncbi:MAG: AbrB/MazE/SpoVT family DNA-binding domain-containing protein [Anaerolineae bacterium]|nr:AbrB/MazE/SpoVT family DNA-binding domain-containing protein [Anaerolineae bacterium]
MNTIVKTRIVRIGNSQGVRIPKFLLDQTDLDEDVELALEENQIVIRSASPVRSGWEAAFQRMAEESDDVLLDGDSLLPMAWDKEEWEW